MTRTRIVCLLAALATVPAAAATAYADGPSQADLDAAKERYLEGKALYEKGDLPGAIGKFKDSYRLSKNPVLLYNIALTLQENKQLENAAFFFRKFLAEAPADAAQRPDAVTRVTAIEDELLGGGSTTDPGKDPGTEPGKDPGTEPGKDPGTEPGKDPGKEPGAIKPAGTYSATDVQHQIVAEAPPAKPLDLTAYVPEDSGFQVTLYFRGANDEGFTARLMKPRYKELVGRIPATKMAGSSMQYYIEVKDAAGTVVTKIGKASSPNIVFIDAAASARFYPDWTDDKGAIEAPVDTKPAGGSGDTKPAGGGDEDPFKLGSDPVIPPADTSGGFFDVGSKKFGYAKWGTTGAAAALLTLSAVFYARAVNASDALQYDADNGCGGGPCTYDDFAEDVAATGKSGELWHYVTLGTGVAVAGLAGYLWYKQLTHKRAPKESATQTARLRPTERTVSWTAVPTLTTGGLGAAALVTF